MADLSDSPAGDVDFDKLLQKVHSLGRDVLSVHAADVDAKARFPRESIDALKQAKLLSAYVPKEYGGMGLEHRAGRQDLRGARPVLRLVGDDLRDAPDPGRLRRASRPAVAPTSATTCDSSSKSSG